MKKTQEQLKADYLNELKTTSTWRKSEKMIKFESGQNAYFVQLHDGGIMPLAKPRIETRFCFGYSDFYANDFDRANEAEENARTNVNYFIEQNLEGLNKTIENLKQALASEQLRTEHGENYYILKHERNGDSEECKIRGRESLDQREVNAEKTRLQKWGNDLEKMTREDLENWLEGVETVKEGFIKRLKTYLKRYGLSKLHTWTYWADA